ncbi:MAG: 50S ribosomal protein L9 [Bacteroidales bacterium OttesenSCG-928-I14]|jgi:large subunit ribosomal protein L9|nr:50S ribosomal protein L9 [Bacteroidales bacterium OttesenSCG-928-I14]
MQIILLENIDKLGDKNDIIVVKNGYGRNFLIPQKKAIIASKSEKKKLVETIRQQSHKLEKIKKDAQILANKLKNISLVVKVKTSSAGKVFGSVTNMHIATELEKNGFKIERKLIDIGEYIKNVGNYKAILKLHKDIIVNIPFNVISE